MAENRKSYRIRTGVGNEAPSIININLTQTYDIVDVLSLEIKQKNFYKMPASGYGVIIGRVIANGGFGVPNAKVSVFIPYDRSSLVEDEYSLYHYTTPLSKNGDGIRYNLLPRHLDKECHQGVGSMYEKEYLLDNKDLIHVFDKYYKYTTVTNDGGDYMIYGVPVGTQTVHVDLDLSDIGVLSQRPRDMIYKGFGVDMFDSPNKFKKGKNLNNLPQIYSQDNVVNVYPFWGDTTVDETNGVITRCDINIDYTFEPTCVFMGSIVSDTGNRAISQRCVPDDEIGKMSDLIAGEGKIEMIRKTFDGKVEEFSIKSNNLIDGDGVWCYQIPMNLDYVMTDEFGNMVPTDDPSKGIPTRARVRFRISMNETETDDTARKRARFLVPNNPKLNNHYPDFNKTHEADYEFGTFTKDESYRDLFWNKVYTVKSYIPRLQKAKALRRRVHTGIKNVNHAGANNPFPFNNLFIRLTFTYRFLCTLITMFCVTVYALNSVLGILAVINYYLGKFFAKLGSINDGFGKLIFDVLLGFMPTISDILAYLLLNSAENMIIKLPNFCDDGNFEQAVYTPMWCITDWFCMTDILQKINSHSDDEYTPIHVYNESLGIDYQFPSNPNVQYDSNLSRLFNCVENQLAQDQECTSFNFSNDWVNGVLYAPLWYRKVRKKKKIFFNLISVPDVDRWCSGANTKYASTNTVNNLSLCQTCAQKRDIENKVKIKPLSYENITLATSVSPSPVNESTCYGYKCHKKVVSFINLRKGLIMPVETSRGDTVYYYKSVEYDDQNLYSEDGKTLGDIKTLFATDIVLLGSLNDCDAEGIPQFFKRLESTTYNMPPDLVQIDYDSKESDLEFEPKPTDKSLLKSMVDMNFGDLGLADIDDELLENVKPESVYTDKTGADWGNYGGDQVTDEYRTPNGYIFATRQNRGEKPYAEFPDVGGLFYGLTCWSAYTKPKTCINVSRICEYGVSLDETQENPVYSGGDSNGGYNYEHMAPDGFISYDELYDRDGRAMFATMNGNNLQTKINLKNGFPVYDFMYLYPDNFDGSMKNLMETNVTPKIYPSPQSNNFKAEESSEAYLRFRYGRNRNDWSVRYYDSKIELGMYAPFGNSAKDNKNRFPKYENSFYFYFGLKPGNTAIDKFRTQYYSECKDTDGENAAVDVEFVGNNWCSEITENGSIIPGDGWVKIDATYLDAPYKVYFANMDGSTEYDVWSDEIIEPKVYFSFAGTVESIENEGFVLKPLYRYEVDSIQEYGLVNNKYRLTITDVNGDEYRRYIEFTKPIINASVTRTPFRMKNDGLRNYGSLNVGDFYANVASLGGKPGGHMSDRNDIGGFVEVTGVNVDGNQTIDFMVEVKPIFNINSIGIAHVTPGSLPTDRSGGNITSPTTYNGSHIEIHQQNDVSQIPNLVSVNNTLMKEGFYEEPPYCPYGYDYPQYPSVQPSIGMPYKTNGGNYDFRFGVPIGGKKYRVTITMLCKKSNRFYPSRNSMSTVVEVPEPIEFKMYINGVDYSIIRDFGLGRRVGDTIYYGTGWGLFNNGYAFPLNYHQAIDFKQYIVGWDRIEDLDGLEELELIPEGMENESQWSYDNYVKDTEAKVTNNYTGTSKYKWNGEYVFNTETVLSSIGTYNDVPDTKQGDNGFIRVLRGVDYVFYVWDNNVQAYQLFTPQGVSVTSITTKEYFEYGDLNTKNSYISELNEVTRLRKQFVQTVKNGFIMRTNQPYSLKVTTATNQTPVKTLIYYSPDLVSGNSNQFITLDGVDKNETECYGIMIPTLTGLVHDINYGTTSTWIYKWRDNRNDSLRFLGDMWLQPLDDHGMYKKPYLVGVQNSIDETLPEYIRQYVTDGIEGYIEDLAPCLFGVHMLDKRLRFDYNVWGSINRWAYYDEIGESNGTEHGDPVTFPGLFAGFILDGTPEYGDNASIGTSWVYPYTYFEEQTIERNNLNIATLTTDANGNVDEKVFPVVRFVFNGEIDTSVYSNYRFVDANVDGLLNNELNVAGKKHILFSEQFAQIRIVDNGNTYTLPLNCEVGAPNVTFEDNRGGGYVVNAVFEDGWCYTFYEGTRNPVYKKTTPVCFTFQEPYTFSHQSGTMNFGDTSFNMNTESGYEHIAYGTGGVQVWDLSIVGNTYKRINYPIIFNGINTYPMTMVYAVKISKDGQRRAVSKTFDLTLMQYYVSVEPQLDDESELISTQTPHNIVLNINIGVRKLSNGILYRGFYYLKHNTFSVDFVDEELGNIANVEIADGYENNTSITYDSDNVTEWIKIVLKKYETGTPRTIIDDFVAQLNYTETCHAFLTDITGLRREMQNASFGAFNHSYCLLNG